ncbi:MAG: DEAD/DEAH box helicase [Bacillota bacterium]
MSFETIITNKSILKNIERSGYETPTSIQDEAIPAIMSGRDVLGIAQTGSGKTAAFTMPILEMLAQEHVPAKQKRLPRALILTPTRELAIQIKDTIVNYGQNLGIRTTTVYGGVSKHTQIQQIKRGIDIIVATPGRFLDLHRMKVIKTDAIRTLVLDEADMMLDMGFIQDVSDIIKHVEPLNQTMLFSATMSKKVSILSKNILENPMMIDVAPKFKTTDTVSQFVINVKPHQKDDVVVAFLEQKNPDQAIIFCRTKRSVDRLNDLLLEKGFNVDSIHGDKVQRIRQKILDKFRNKQVKYIVATEVLSRGIDINALPVVLNYDTPEDPDAYIHRIGRTARANIKGEAYTIVTKKEQGHIREIEAHIGQKIKTIDVYTFLTNTRPANEKAINVNPFKKKKSTSTKSFTKKAHQTKPYKKKTEETKIVKNDSNVQHPFKKKASLAKPFKKKKKHKARNTQNQEKKPFYASLKIKKHNR